MGTDALRQSFYVKIKETAPHPDGTFLQVFCIRLKRKCAIFLSPKTHTQKSIRSREKKNVEMELYLAFSAGIVDLIFFSVNLYLVNIRCQFFAADWVHFPSRVRFKSRQIPMSKLMPFYYCFMLPLSLGNKRKRNSNQGLN